MFGAAELEEAGRELVSAGLKIAELDSGRRYPIRNAQPHLCRGCRWRAACPNPGDDLYLSTLFESVAPKRARNAQPDDTQHSDLEMPPAAPAEDPLRGARGPAAQSFERAA
jgi:hypothetical protein